MSSKNNVRAPVIPKLALNEPTILGNMPFLPDAIQGSENLFYKRE